MLEIELMDFRTSKCMSQAVFLLLLLRRPLQHAFLILVDSNQPVSRKELLICDSIAYFELCFNSPDTDLNLVGVFFLRLDEWSTLHPIWEDKQERTNLTGSIIHDLVCMHRMRILGQIARHTFGQEDVLVVV